MHFLGQIGNKSLLFTVGLELILFFYLATLVTLTCPLERADKPSLGRGGLDP